MIKVKLQSYRKLKLKDNISKQEQNYNEKQKHN